MQVVDLLANQWNREGALPGTFQAHSKQPEGFGLQRHPGAR